MTRQLLKLSALGLFVLILAAGCGKKKKQILDLQTEKAQLESEFEKKDSLLNELFVTVNAIEQNLSDITVRQKLITDAPAAEKRTDLDVREKIMEEIIMINNIMEENKKRIAQLKDQLKKSDLKSASLQENIRILTQRLQEKEQEITALKAELVRLNFKIETLNSTVDTLRGESAAKSKVISQQDLIIGEMKTVWYVIGTKKELLDKEIIDKTGGLFGSDMKMSEMINPDYFTQSDMRDISKISFEAKKAELVTVHAAGSYQFIEENDKITGLEILNPDEFWKSSRFLVVMIK